MIERVVLLLRGSQVSGIGAGAVYSVLYISAASSIYFALGVISEKALGLTPFIFAIAGLFFAISLMSYVEGSSLHLERGGASSFARHAFNEFWSFVAGWAILLDYAIVLALVTFTIPNYLATFWSPIGSRWGEMIVPAIVIAGVAFTNIRGVTAGSLRRSLPFGWLDLLLQCAVIVIGLALVWNPSALVDTVELGEMPTWTGLVAAAILATVAYTGIEAASGLAGEVQIPRRQLRRMVSASVASIMTVYVGFSIVALMAVPVEIDATGTGSTALSTTFAERPVIGVVSGIGPGWLSDVMMYVFAVMAPLVLLQAARVNMLGPVRLSYALATNRQIPSFVGRLHPKYGTPHIAAILMALFSFALVLTDDIEFLASMYAFGALLALSIANLSICVLRYREPDAKPAFQVPLSVKIGKGRLPIPSVLAFVGSLAAWSAALFLRPTATIVGCSWMLGGVVLFVAYRRLQGNSLTKRVTVPEADLRSRAKKTAASRVSYGSILVPVFGGILDDDIVGTAGRLALDEGADEEGGAMIEALHVIEIPMSQPIDAPVPEERIQRARRILARAKEVGEEYEGVEVATATVRARATGEAIVREAARRGVEAIVLAAERPSRIRGGPLLGGVDPRAFEFVGKVTEYVTRKAPCRVILTAPPELDAEALAESIKDNPYLSEEFALREQTRLDQSTSDQSNQPNPELP